MAITPTEKIWFNGELIPWDSARIHILTHSLHYGMGVSFAPGPRWCHPPR